MPDNFPVASRGYQEHLGIAVEDHPDETSTTAYGTVKTCTDFLRNTQWNIQPADPMEARPSPSGYPVEHYAGGIGDETRDIEGVPDVRGSINGELDFHVAPLLLLNALGVYGRTNFGYVLTGAADPWTHTADFPTAPQPPSHALTLVRYAGRENLRLGGCYVETFEISGEVEGPLAWSADIVGQNYERAPSSPGTPTFVDGAIPRLFEAKLYISTTLGDTIVPATHIRRNIRNFTLTVGNTLRAETASGVENSSGSASAGRGIRRPIIEDYVPVDLRISTDWESDYYQDLLRVLGQGGYVTAELHIVHSVVANRSYVFRMPAAKAREPGYPNFGGGAAPNDQEITFRAGTFLNGATPEIFRATIINGHDRYLAANADF